MNWLLHLQSNKKCKNWHINSQVIPQYLKSVIFFAILDGRDRYMSTSLATGVQRRLPIIQLLKADGHQIYLGEFNHQEFGRSATAANWVRQEQTYSILKFILNFLKLQIIYLFISNLFFEILKKNSNFFKHTFALI